MRFWTVCVREGNGGCYVGCMRFPSRDVCIPEPTTSYLACLFGFAFPLGIAGGTVVMQAVRFYVRCLCVLWRMIVVKEAGKWT